MDEPKRETVLLGNEEEKGDNLDSSSYRKSAVHHRVYDSEKYSKID